MPVSKNRRRKFHKKTPQPKASPKWAYSEFSLKEEHYENLKNTALEVAKRGLDDYPATLKAINEELRKADPIGILATLAFYGLHTTATQSEGVGQKSLMKDILQHHVEVLQALVLAVPVMEWQTVPFMPGVIQRVMEALPKITDTFLHERVLAAQGVDDKVKFTLLSLQQRMRLQTHGIRNWGYFPEVIRISTELFAPLNRQFDKHFGFGTLDLIRVMTAVVNDFERRSNEHWSTLAKVFREPTTRRMIKTYYDSAPNISDTPDEVLSALPQRITRVGMMCIIMGHFDLRLSDIATFKPDEIAALTGISAKVVAAALKAISLEPGSLANDKIDMFLGNPVWDRPGIDLGHVFFLPIPQMFFSHIHRVMERLATEAGLKTELEDRRAAYLEDQLVKVITKGLPGAKLSPSAKWKLGAEQFETDLLVTFDRTILIAEAKSNRLTASGLRGAPSRVKRHVEDMILYPSIQSARLENLISDARNGNTEANITVRQLGIDPTIVDQVIRISVTLDDFSILSSAESEFKEIGWVPMDHRLAPTILISDLICLVDILANPLLILHYLSERIYLQKSFRLLGDELDFLGVYLETGFNIAGLRDENSTLSPSGMSQQLDRYYMSKDAGIALPKPKAKLRPLFAQTIKKLDDRRSHGWTTAGLHILSLGDPDEQKGIETKLVQLRGMVRRNYRDSGHLCSLRVRPLKERKAQVIFYLFPEPLRDSSKAIMQQLAFQALDEDDSVKIVVVFGRSTERWKEPYEIVVVATRTGE